LKVLVQLSCICRIQVEDMHIEIGTFLFNVVLIIALDFVLEMSLTAWY